MLGIKDSVEHGVYRGFTKLSGSLIIGEPKLQKPAKTAQVTIDAGQFPHLLIIDDAVDLITLAHFAQVASDAHACLLRMAFNDLPLFLEHRDTQVVSSFLLGITHCRPPLLRRQSVPSASRSKAGGSLPASQSRMSVEHHSANKVQRR